MARCVLFARAMMPVMHAKSACLAVVACALAIACGPRGDAPAPRVRPDAEAPSKVAHYTTGDGMVGLVLDRSGALPKMRWDDATDVLELSMDEERSGVGRTGWSLRDADGRKLLHLGVDGDLTAFPPSNPWGLTITKDRRADPLPAPTKRIVAKAPPPPPSKWALDLAANAVRVRLPHLLPEDSGDLTKVAEAFRLAKPEMFVHVTDAGSKSAAWAPASTHIGGEHRGQSGGFEGLEETEESWDKTHRGLARFGVKLEGLPPIYGQPNHVRMRRLKGWPPPLAAGTAGLVWETEPTLVLVTVDAGRYELGTMPDASGGLAAGWGASSTWPRPLQHAALDVYSVGLLARGRAISDQTHKELEALEEAWSDCVLDAWRAAKAELDKVETSGLPRAQREGQASAIM
jgi:hypothetical protein